MTLCGFFSAKGYSAVLSGLTLMMQPFSLSYGLLAVFGFNLYFNCFHFIST